MKTLLRFNKNAKNDPNKVQNRNYIFELLDN